MLVGDLVILVNQKLDFLVFFKLFLGRLQWSAGLSFLRQCISNASFKFHTNTDNVSTANGLQDLMHRSYNIDIRLAPAFTYTPVYKDPKNSFKLQLSWGPFNGAIPKLKRTKKVSFQKLFLMKYILSHLKPCFSQMSMRMMVGSQGSPTVHSYPALLIQGIQNTWNRAAAKRHSGTRHTGPSL